MVLSHLAKKVRRRPGGTEWHGVAPLTRAMDVRAQAGVRDLAAYPKLIHFRIPAACVQVEDHERGLRRGRHRCSAAVSAGVHTLGKVADRYCGFKIGGEPRGSGLGCFILSGKPTTRTADYAHLTDLQQPTSRLKGSRRAFPCVRIPWRSTPALAGRYSPRSCSCWKRGTPAKIRSTQHVTAAVCSQLHRCLRLCRLGGLRRCHHRCLRQCRLSGHHHCRHRRHSRPRCRQVHHR